MLLKSSVANTRIQGVGVKLLLVKGRGTPGQKHQVSIHLQLQSGQSNSQFSSLLQRRLTTFLASDFMHTSAITNHALLRKRIQNETDT